MAELLIDPADIQAWSVDEKVDTGKVEEALAIQLTSQVLGIVSKKYDTETWLSIETTPIIIRKIISMLYVGFLYHRAFAVDDDPGIYGTLLINNAETLLTGIVNGYINVVDSVLNISVNTNTTATIAKELVNSDPVFLMSMEF